MEQALLENQQALNDAQIRMMQAQLNPHFLCNTLDTMKWISKINQVPQVALMSTNLADILRFCISPDEFVELRQELAILGRYVEIQRIRLSDSFTFAQDVPDMDSNQRVIDYIRDIAEYVELDEIFAKSDVISLHCPLFPSTEGIINKDNIARMKDGVIIINNSRGQLIVEKDLADALNSGKVYAAGLDVVSTEPIKSDNPLLKAKNCIITPHISWAPKEARQRIMDMSVENLKQFLAGDPVNVVNW